MPQRLLHFCPACGKEFNRRIPMVGTHHCRECGFRFTIDERLIVTPLDRLEQIEVPT